MLPYLNILKGKGINCYIQYTLNNYEKENLEKGVPALDSRIETFRQLVDELGYGKVIWRFDPLILTDHITIDDLLSKIEYIGDRLKGYTEKLVFSFADITSYRKVKCNLNNNHIRYREFDETTMNEFARQLALLNEKWNYTLATCGEKIDIEQFGIQHNHCIDDDLMIRYFADDKILMDHLGIEIRNGGLFDPIQIIHKKNNKDKGQRLYCGCIASKDIGEYNTCPHQCEYCYANTTKEAAIANWKNHCKNRTGETITGL